MGIKKTLKKLKDDEILQKEFKNLENVSITPEEEKILKPLANFMLDRFFQDQALGIKHKFSKHNR